MSWLLKLRAALWTLRALGSARRQLKDGPRAVNLPKPPPASMEAFQGVYVVLCRRRHTCLERSLILQRWHAANGSPIDVIIGVTGAASGFRAHAWLDGEIVDADYQELSRLLPVVDP